MMTTESKLNVFLFEPYYGGSHKYWADNIVKYSQHDVNLFTLPARFWKWRMKASSISLFDLAKSNLPKADVIISSSLMDVSLLRALMDLHHFPRIPIVYYLHENQLTYPFSSHDQRLDENLSYGFENYKSCLVSDEVIFNSAFHKNEFHYALKKFLKRLPDHKNLSTIENIISKSKVIGVGIDVDLIVKIRDSKKSKFESFSPILLWNHRWESDKNPDLFFKLCCYLKNQELDFNLIITGKSSSTYPPVFDKIYESFQSRILFFGYAETYVEYISLIKSADLCPITSNQDFYGISFLEATLCNVKPIVPADKVYQEHFNELDESLIYDSEIDLFKKCANLLRLTNRQNNIRLNKSSINIKQVIKDIDKTLITLCSK